MEFELLQQRLTRKNEEIRAYREAHCFIVKGERDEMPISSKCHQQPALGHNRLNCGMEQCNSSTFCGKLAKHLDEK